MAKKLLIVESPKKARTLQKFLKNDWIVRASYGHVRQLAKDGADKLGFDLIGDEVHCRYVPTSSRALKNLRELKKLAKQASLVVLATDRDREGEGISFHLKEALGLRRFERITYNEVTEAAIRQALANPRQLDENLVGAALARACLDKLVGFKVSPILWSLNIGAKSTGRVQAPTLHIVCQREREIQSFQPEPYWTVWVDYQEGFRAYFRGEEASRAAHPESNDANERDDSEAQDAQKADTVRVMNPAAAQRLVESANSHPHRVVKVETRLTYKRPPPPFTTSSLQQAAGARLKFSPEKTMQLAQHLFESGLITYHRTDSTSLSESFVTAARNYLQDKDPDNLPRKAPKFRSKKGAQEAHEAIRPTDLTRPSTQLKQELDSDHFALYELIWRRAMASQCQAAQINKTRITSKSGSVFWQAKGQVLKFPGYIRYWRDFGGDSELPLVKEGAALSLKQAGSEKRMTQPLPRYSEAKLVQVMERKGIGRPSTYSSTVKTLKERGYVKIAKGKLQATELGLAVDEFQIQTFPQLVESEFTAEMETQLDAISQGRQDWQKYLTGWHRDYFAIAVEKARAQAVAEAREKPSQYNSRTKAASKSRPKREPVPSKKSKHLCPLCNSPLVERAYQKNGQTKKMLLCSSSKAKKPHQDVVFFQSKGKWWSPKLGEL